MPERKTCTKLHKKKTNISLCSFYTERLYKARCCAFHCPDFFSHAKKQKQIKNNFGYYVFIGPATNQYFYPVYHLGCSYIFHFICSFVRLHGIAPMPTHIKKNTPLFFSNFFHIYIYIYIKLSSPFFFFKLFSTFFPKIKTFFFQLLFSQS